MIGINKFNINLATMNAAVEHYFKTEMFCDEDFEVVSVIPDSVEKGFVVTLKGTERKPEPEVLTSCSYSTGGRK